MRVARTFLLGALLGALVSAAPAAAAQSSSGLTALSDELDRNWDDGGRDAVHARIKAAIEGLVSSTAKSTGARFTSMTVDRIGLDRAPAFAALSTSKVNLRLPGYDSSTPDSSLWSVKFHGATEVTVLGAVIGRPTVTVELKAIKVALEMKLDGADCPKVTSVGEPDISFDAELDASSAFFDAVLAVVEAFAGPLADAIAAPFVDSISAALVGGPSKYGTGGSSVGGITGAGVDYETEARLISETIRRDCLPYGSLVEVRRDGTSSARGQGAVVELYPTGDSAIWTGHYLAAEAYRYAATGDADALDAVRKGLDGVKKLLEVTGGDGYLARVLAPKGSAAADYIKNHAQAHGAYRTTYGGREYIWEGDPSRDQYLGVVFGLSTTYRLVSDSSVRSTCKSLVSAIVTRLDREGWKVGAAPASAAVVVDPKDFEDEVEESDDAIGTAFWTKFDQQVAIALVGKQVDATAFKATYDEVAPLVEYAWFPVWLETFDPVNSYYKFNLDHISLATILRLESSSTRWRSAYRAFRILREALAHHQNAHFDLVEMSVLKPSSGSGWTTSGLSLESGSASLAGESRALLKAWLDRPARYVNVDLRSSVATQSYKAPGSDDATTIAKTPVPVADRPTTDFLWQRSPFDLRSSGDGTRETAGVDYLLPYWMARYHGVLGATAGSGTTTRTTVSATTTTTATTRTTRSSSATRRTP